MNAEERAKRMAGNLYGVLIDYEKEMPEVVVAFFAKEIRAAEYEATEKWATVARRLLPYLPGDVTTKMKPEHVQAANEIRALIEQLEEE